jgi:sec-independent protein translocase protein TatC
MLGCGIAFELPGVSYVLAKYGLITGSFLRSYFKFAFRDHICSSGSHNSISLIWTSQFLVAPTLVIFILDQYYPGTRVEKQEA